jgi:recombination protein RecA
MAKAKDKGDGFVLDPNMPIAERRKLGASAAAKAILGKYGENTIAAGDDKRFTTARRIPTGSFMLDYALNGGWPRGRVNMVWGDRSAGKTTLMLKMIAAAQRMDALTNRFIWEIPEEEHGDIVPFDITYLDVEGAYDASWAKRLGVNTEILKVSRPASAEETGDVAQAILESGSCDILVVDSLAAQAPKDEANADQEAWQQGLAARLNNKMFRKFNRAQNRVNKLDEGKLTPTVFLINQERLKIGLMFGDPRVKPGGKAQDFVTSAEVLVWGNKVEYYDEKEKQIPKQTSFSFKIKKLKVGPPGIEGEYTMAISDDPDGNFGVGDVLEDSLVLDFAERVKILEKVSPTEWKMYDEKFKRKKDLEEAFVQNKDKFLALKRDILGRLCPHQ